jgi:hypothetical protein
MRVIMSSIDKDANEENEKTYKQGGRILLYTIRYFHSISHIDLELLSSSYQFFLPSLMESKRERSVYFYL